MPRIEIPLEPQLENGAEVPAIVAGDFSEGHFFDGTKDSLIEATNTSAGALTITFVTSYETPGGIELEDNGRSVPAGETWTFKFKSEANRRYYKQAADSNRIWVDITADDWEFRGFDLT